jgi:glycerol uptake facilitator-like aquaporin
MHGPFLGEFMGTLVLILLGDGVVANVLPIIRQIC